MTLTDVPDQRELKRKRQLARFLAIGLLNFSEIGSMLREIRQLFQEEMLLDKMIETLWLEAKLYSSSEYPLQDTLRREAIEKGLIDP